MTREQARREIDSLDFYLQNHMDDYGEESHTAMMMAKDALSCSEKPNKWIPVSERLPEENGRYLVYLNTKVFPIRILHFAKNLNEISLDFNCSFKSKKVGWYDYDSENGFFEWTGVEAWMPLPEPCKAESKKYKRMYEELLKQPVQFKVERYKIDTVRFKRHYPTELVMQDGSSYFRHCVVKDIAHSLAERLDKYIDYRTEFCPHTNEYWFVGEIKVVSRK